MEIFLLLLWIAAYVALLIWSLAKKSRMVGGGVALTALALFPTTYGRWTTPSEWHDYPMMALYYLPTLLAALLSLTMVVVGLVIKVRQALHARRGA